MADAMSNTSRALNRSGLAAMLLAGALAAGSSLFAADARWLERAHHLVSKPGGPKEALAYLGGLPLEARETFDCLWIAARAFKAVGDVEQAAICAATRRLPANRAYRDLGDVQQWLAQRAQTLYDEAVASLIARPEVASAKYLTAVLCDPAILGRDDHGLGPKSANVLDLLAYGRSAQPRYGFLVGVYHHQCSRIEDAEKAFQLHARQEKDPLMRWMTELLGLS